MSDEISIRSSLQVDNGDLSYQSRPTAFTADQAHAAGPSPGNLIVPTAGVDVDFSQVGTAGVCRLMNLDATNFVTVGVYHTLTNMFFPLLELLPGETYVVRLARHFGEDYVGTGTGTSGGGNRLRIRADTAQCNVLVEAFSI